MPLNLASPGIVVKEVDLTVGRVDPTAEGIGAIVGPFAKGTVNEPVLINNEQELLNTFGNPYATDNHYETWMVASSYLAYGGALQVVRSDDTSLKNAFAGSGSAPKIKSYEDYVNLGYDENTLSGVTVAARNPGSWANGVKVAIIDAKADQILSGFSGLDGLGTGVAVGMGITQSMVGKTKVSAGSTSALDGYLKGIITEASATQISVKVLEHVSASGTVTEVDYQPGGAYSFTKDGALGIHTAGMSTSFASATGTTQQDWFDNQSITLSNSTISWNTLAERPSTSTYAANKGSRFDEVHVVVFDDTGDVTGNAGTILEKHTSLSKAKDAQYSAGATSYWRKYTAEASEYIFAGSAPAGIVTTGFASGTFNHSTDMAWDQNTLNIDFGATGNQLLTLSGGLNYDGGSDINATGALTAGVGDLSLGYDLFANNEEFPANFILMGGGGYDRPDAQALASKVIAVAEVRKDAVAFVSPCRNELLTMSGNGYTVKSGADITDNLIEFYSSVPSSSYGVLDSGYKYMYDRFSDTFRYVPLNGDMAGLCARNDTASFPWYSPAGTARGGILNAVKLAYNPSQIQRDRLYSARINPVIFTPGGGITLFGDKTALNKSSAFDRINVRRLFIYLEEAIKGAGRDVMFEFNDALTRSSFVNAVEPFLRDVQAKRGIQDFRLICDETNNTAAVVDANEFVADIFIKPSRSINFIGLTFVATRSGVSFSEVVGNA
tara:strand:+ start:324 stop:2492 length:2169 start_codon:yes stop_codon:yes gene_type:complete